MKANLNHSAKMKCDFNCNHVRSGLAQLKTDAVKTRLEESSILNYEEGSCKDCVKEAQRLLHSELQNATPRNFDHKTEGRLLHNKENQQVLYRFGEGACEMEALENSRFNEESGYSSMLSSEYNDPTEHEDSILLAGNIYGTPNHCLMNQSQAQLSKKTLLPVTHFEELVCSTLKKSGKRNLKSWAIVDRIVSQGSIGFRNLIGRKMGLHGIDILGELFQRDLRHLLANILRHLEEMDLINVAKVSPTWKNILKEDKWAFQVYSKAVKNLSDGSVQPSEHTVTREYVLYRAALASVQTAAPPNSSSKKASRSKASNQSNQNGSYSRHMEFSEAAKTLKNTESLKVCSRCSSPAKYDSYLQRATCSRESCSFDFCTKCLCSYHNSRDCASGKPMKSSSQLGLLPGTKKSKQNLRRL
ncbi:FERM domain-containing protein 1 [Platysternon megacephalum]|uniref:FERM domain-containing protein 1 n=1 Tax=Platysternon megacephalum TaxID=55544 RepID=A0A4D9EBC7_9SAUR|nr:FERM domain-containing protein 1 [Platysternon megacephalum]